MQSTFYYIYCIYIYMPLKLHNLDLNMMSFKFESSNRADFFRWTSCASLVGRLSVRAGLFAGQRWIYSGKLWFFMSVEPQIHLIWPIEVQFSYPYVKGWFHKPWIQDPPTGPFRISCFFFQVLAESSWSSTRLFQWSIFPMEFSLIKVNHCFGKRGVKNSWDDVTFMDKNLR